MPADETKSTRVQRFVGSECSIVLHRFSEEWPPIGKLVAALATHESEWFFVARNNWGQMESKQGEVAECEQFSLWTE